MSNSTQMDRVLDGMLNFNAETREILDSIKERMDSIFNKEYYINPDPVVVKALEDRIEDIIKEYPDYQNSSVVAYKTFLKKGDAVEVNNSLNNGEVFINGKLATGNYTYTGNDTELIDVVVFETGYYMSGVAYPPVLGATPSYFPHEIYIKNIGQVPEIADAYYLYANKITTYNFLLPGYARGCRVLVANGTTDYNQKIPITVQEVYSNCEKLTRNLAVKYYTTKVSLPECKEIVGEDILRDLSVTNWEFGKLNKIQSTTNNNAMFYNSYTVYIPDTVKYIIGKVCRSNTNVRLECNKAISISDDWCNDAPTNFSMAKNWDASINIAIAAKNWTKDRFLELFEDLVPVDITGTGADYARELTIPAAIFDTLTDEEYAIVEDKGWVLGGA